MIKPKSMEELMSPVTISSWFFGMGVIEIPYGKRWPVVSFLYALVLTSVYIFLAEISDMYTKSTMTMASIGAIIFSMAIIYGNACLSIFGTLLGWMRVKKMKNLIVRLEESDRKLKKMGISRDYELIFWRQIMYLVLQFLLPLALGIVTYDPNFPNEATSWQKFAFVVTLYYPIVVTSIGDYSFLTFVRFITLRFNGLNKYLMTMSTTTNDSPQHKRVLEYTRSNIDDIDDTAHEKRTNDDSKAMKAAREYHHELVKITHMIDDTFGRQALLSIGVSFALITVLLYRTSIILMKLLEGKEIKVEHLTIMVCWLTFYIYKIVVINTTCARASIVAEKTGKIICHLHEPSTSKEYRNAISDFTLQTIQHSVTFTACGYFELNHRFLHGIISSVTTYMVILVQIDEAPENANLEITTLSPP